MTTRRTDHHAALNDAVSRRESDWVDADGKDIHDHDRGLLYDLGTMNRRRALTLLAGAGLWPVLSACGTRTCSTSPAAPAYSSRSSSSSSSTIRSSSSTSSAGQCTLCKRTYHTAGISPRHGSN